MTTSLAIETSALTRRFGDHLAVDSLELKVPKGCICGFLGPNGAGKTTTIKVLLGILRPSAGTFRIDGQLFTRENKELRRRVGALIETPSLYGHLTGRENLEVRRRLLNEKVQRIGDVLRLFSLTEAGEKTASMPSW